MRGKIARLFFIFALMLAVAWIAGCLKSETPKEKGTPAKKEAGPGGGKNEASAKEETAATETSTERPAYDPSYRWDPFRVPPIIHGPEKEKEPDLDQLMLMGTVKGQGMEAAFILYPGGKDRIVKKYDTIGKYQGKVTEIGNCYIIVEESYIDPSNMNTTFKIMREMRIQDTECDKARSQ